MSERSIVTRDDETHHIDGSVHDVKEAVCLFP